MKTSKKIPLQEFHPVAESVLEQVLGVHGVLSRLRQVKSGDEYTFNHSLNVGIYAVLIGSWLNYDEKALRQLAMAGLLHDTGKAKISMDILGKPGPLTADEFEIMKRHSLFGYQMIKATTGIASEVGMAVLQHHEREDGTGYPLNLTSRNISMFAKIVAVADTYDAITSDRSYKAKRTAYTAADIIMKESFKTFDPVVVQSFLARITNYFFTDRVRLSNGMIGTIVSINNQRPTRPLIQTEQGFIDLDKASTLAIVEVLP
jgi:HD-GYP domain-containing protein (c-di-GMP phosphodiesterase class II)